MKIDTMTAIQMLLRHCTAVVFAIAAFWCLIISLGNAVTAHSNRKLREPAMSIVFQGFIAAAACFAVAWYIKPF